MNIMKNLVRAFTGAALTVLAGCGFERERLGTQLDLPGARTAGVYVAPDNSNTPRGTGATGAFDIAGSRIVGPKPMPGHAFSDHKIAEPTPASITKSTPTPNV